jgi:proteic killer suppression protein
MKKLAKYTFVVYYINMIRNVHLSRIAKKSLAKLPVYIALKLQDWVEDVEKRGLEEVRKTPGYHDEPLQGALRGYRSIRLSRHYRAYYKIVKQEVEFVLVERIDKHEY